MIEADAPVRFALNIFGIAIIVVVYWLRKRSHPKAMFVAAIGLSLAAACVVAFWAGPEHAGSITSATVVGLMALAYSYVCWLLVGAIEQILSRLRNWTDSI